MRVNPVSRSPAITQGYYRRPSQSTRTVDLNTHKQDKQEDEQMVVQKLPVRMIVFLNFLCWFILAFGFGYILAQVFRWWLI